jgi:hypothetical protein
MHEHFAYSIDLALRDELSSAPEAEVMSPDITPRLGLSEKLVQDSECRDRHEEMRILRDAVPLLKLRV